MRRDEELIERCIFPWCRDESQDSSEGARRKMTIFNKIKNKSLSERASFYFRTPPEDYKARSNLSIPMIDEYEICTTMWEKFGINSIELESLDANWVSDMLMMLSEDNKAENERMSR